jgi:DNA-directed RNA polymerase specialized sigma24 family protein
VTARKKACTVGGRRIRSLPADHPCGALVSDHSTTLRYWLGRHNAGDPAALNELLRFSQDRVLDHIRFRFRAFPRLRPYVDSQDVLADVQLTLARDFRAEPFTDLMHFLRLTGRLARHRTVDLARKYFGPHGAGTHERHAPPADDSADRTEPADADPSPAERALRAEVDEVIAGLPAEHRDLFDLLFYAGLSRADAAEALGVSLATLDRRWVAAREALRERYGNEMPF